MINGLLEWLDRRGWRWILFPLISFMYFLRGSGFVPVKYHSSFRAWEFKVKGIIYLSPGPGWAYQFDYLHRLLLETYFRFFTPGPGDCIIDLGAGLGEETVIFAQLVGKTGMVFSIEANPVTAGALQYACRCNHFDQVQVHNLAIAAEEGTVQIENNPVSYVGNTIEKENSIHSTFTVPALSMDLFVERNGIQKIDLLKSNIEGAEQFLIQGMSRSIDILRVAAISCHDFRHVYHNESKFYATREKVIDFFKNHDFEIKMIRTGHRINDDIIYGINKKTKLG
jgi:FkbM family methyltransferase